MALFFVESDYSGEGGVPQDWSNGFSIQSEHLCRVQVAASARRIFEFICDVVYIVPSGHRGRYSPPQKSYVFF